MKNTLRTLALSLLCLPAIAADLPESWDGLVQVKAKQMDAAYLLPGADFRAYTRVMIDPAEVAFRKNWMRDVNESRPGLSNKITEEDAERIAAAARSGFADVFGEAFRAGGYEVVTSAGPGVLRLSPAVIDLYLNAPDTMSAGRSRTYSMEAGVATLALEARDSTSGALLGRVLDRRETRQSAGLQLSSSVTNLSDFKALFRKWADICVKGLGELKAQSPVPADLKPKQKL